MSDERAHDTASESKTSDGNLAALDVANDEGSENDRCLPRSSSI